MTQAGVFSLEYQRIFKRNFEAWTGGSTFLCCLLTPKKMQINFTLEGKTEMARRFKNIDAGLKDFRPEFEKSGNFLKDFFGGEVFSSRGSVIGEPWKPRKPPTGNWPILEKTGKMRRSFRSKADSKSAEIWNSADYFKYHQSRMPRKKLPRRIMFKLDEQRKQRITKFFHEAIVKVLRKK